MQQSVLSTPVRKSKHARYSGDIKNVENASPRSLISYIRILQEENIKKTKENKKLRRICRNQNKKIVNWNLLFMELKEKQLISKDSVEMMQVGKPEFI